MKDKKIEKLIKKAEKLNVEELACHSEIAAILKKSYGYPDDTFVDYTEGDGLIIGFEGHYEIEAIPIRDEIIPYYEL